MLQRLTSIVIALLFSVFLLAFPPGGYAMIPYFKYTLFLVICGGYVAVTIITRLQMALIGIQPINRIRVKDTPIPIMFLLVYLLFVVISALLSAYPGTFRGMFRREGVLTIAIYVLGGIFLSKYFRPQKWMLFLLGISTILFCTLSFVQLTGANPFTLYPPGHNYYGAGVYYSGEYIGTLGNAGLSAAFLCIAVGVFSMALIKLETMRKRWLLAIPVFFTALVIFSIGVGAAELALTTGLILMLPVAITNQKTLTRTMIVFAIIAAAFAVSQILGFYDGGIDFKTPRSAIVFAAGILALLAALVAKYGTKIPDSWYRPCAIAATFTAISLAVVYLRFFGYRHTGMIYEISEVLRGRWDDTFGTRRVYIWRNVIEGIRVENLLFGTGPDTLGYWPIEPFRRYVPELGITLTAIVDDAHNKYLHILATTGLLSLLAYLSALVYTGVKWFRQPNNILSAIVGTGLLLFSIQAFFGISMFIVAPFFWTGLAILIYSQEDYQKNREDL